MNAHYAPNPADRTSLLIVMFAFAAALGGFWAGLKFFGNDPIIGVDAPEFSLRDSTGKLVALSDFRGRRVLVNFWATWCGPCIEEMPMLDAIADAQSDELVVLGVAEDEPGAVLEFLKAHPVNYPILQSSSVHVALSGQFGNTRNVLPYSVLVDEKGVIARSKAGMFMPKELERFVR